MVFLLRGLAAAFVAAMVVWGGVARAQETAPAGDAGRGKQLYNGDGCFECHGYVGQGARMTGPRVAPMELPFDAFAQQLRHPANEMPPYAAAALADQDVADIYTYLRGIPGPEHAAKDIPLLNQ